jgi:hypothetical protein
MYYIDKSERCYIPILYLKLIKSMNIISPYANATTATITYYASKLLNKLIGIYNVFAQLINIYMYIMKKRIKYYFEMEIYFKN